MLEQKNGVVVRSFMFSFTLLMVLTGVAYPDNHPDHSALEKAMHALQQSDPKQQQTGVQYVLEHADTAPSIAMFLAAAGAYRLSMLEDSAFLYYSAQIRAGLDLERFKPVGTGSNSPEVAIGAIQQSLGRPVNISTMRNPVIYANVVKRIEKWEPYAIGSYDPGWEYSVSISEVEARHLGKKHKSGFLKSAKGMSKLLNDPEYFESFLIVQGFNLSAYEEQQKPTNIKKKEAAEKKLLAIEKTRDIEGMFYQKALAD